MPEMHAEPVVRWRVRYPNSEESSEVLLPHAWRQDLSIDEEGPVSYQTVIQVPRGRSYLLFRGASYAAEVWIEGQLVTFHRGMWDAFDVLLDGYAGTRITVEVRLTKNGGPTYPVSQTAGGRLPYLFQTFGGLYAMVELVRGAPAPEPAAATPRIRVDGRHLNLDGKPFYVRGLLHSGWYPDLGHPNPPDSIIREEVREAKARGFNLIKFGDWVPSHGYLEVLEEEGLVAWMELPLFRFSPDEDQMDALADEVARIVRQYRHHGNIVAWSLGREIAANVDRDRLYQLVKNLSGCPLVGDADFAAVDASCDLTFLPGYLDAVSPAGTMDRPALVNETGGMDVHRDLSRLGDELPYWTSTLTELNARGVRERHALPHLLIDNRFATHPTRNRHGALMESSRRMALFALKRGHELLRARDSLGGYVVREWRDTPISASGLFDDWLEPRYSPEECLPWNGESILFLIPSVSAKWVHGGVRPDWQDPWNVAAGPVRWEVGLHAPAGAEGGLVWRVVRPDDSLAACGAAPFVSVAPHRAQAVGVIRWDATPGEYWLEVEFDGVTNRWPIWVTPPISLSGLRMEDPSGRFGDWPTESSLGALPVRTVWSNESGPAIYVLDGEGTRPAPFWREAAYEFRNEAVWRGLPLREQWSRLAAIASDRALAPRWLAQNVGDHEVVLNRIDTLTYEEAPLLVRSDGGWITSLRPQGGLGAQPSALSANVVGQALLSALAGHLRSE